MENPQYYHHPRLYMRYVDDTFVYQQQGQMQTFLEHINNMDPAIKFTVVGNKGNEALTFLDTLVKFEADHSLSLTVYRETYCTLITSYSGTATTT